MDSLIMKQALEWAGHVSEPELAEELEGLLSAEDDSALTDAFYRDLAFGTAGLRGVLGVGTNRMNRYTVGRATQGLGKYLVDHYDQPSVVIARDSRNNGELFVETAAAILAAYGIKVYVFPRVEPVPLLSFAVRHLHTSAGICITASHNPKEYNGYKVYDHTGCQIANDAALAISEAIEKAFYFPEGLASDFQLSLDDGIIQYVDDQVVEAFLDAVELQYIPDALEAADKDSFSLVYTPLCGSGMECMDKLCRRLGLENVYTPETQRKPDGDFPTCASPNPEIREAFDESLVLADEIHPDLILATDPDADRMGVAVPHAGDYQLLSGNEMGILLMDWLCRMKVQAGEDLTERICISTVVSSMMADALAEAYGFEMRRCLTGFKYIGEQIDQLAAVGEQDRFLLGFEESYGYLAGTHVRDKDAIVASQLAMEMGFWYAARGMDLVDAMETLYQRYGYYLNSIVNITFPGQAGSEDMVALMRELRENHPQQLAGFKVVDCVDYTVPQKMPRVAGLQKEPGQMLPVANVLQFDLEDNNKVIIRPSGTEPKIKAYLFSYGVTRQEAEDIQQRLAAAAKDLLSL